MLVGDKIGFGDMNVAPLATWFYQVAIIILNLRMESMIPSASPDYCPSTPGVAFGAMVPMVMLALCPKGVGGNGEAA